MMKLNSDDVTRLIRACRTYQDQTGSEYMWDQYEKLIDKLQYYEEENNSGQCTENHTSRKNPINVQTFGGSGNLCGEKRFRCARGEKEMV